MTEVLSFLEKTLQKQLADENHRVISNLVYTEEDIAIIESVFRNVILSYSVNTSTASNKAYRNSVEYLSEKYRFICTFLVWHGIVHYKEQLENPSLKTQNLQVNLQTEIWES